MIIGTTNCMTLRPRFPPAALSPSAVPLRRSGKKNAILVMDEAKLPPPNPAVAAVSRKNQYGVPGRVTQ